jgi:hypothetical protein
VADGIRSWRSNAAVALGCLLYQVGARGLGDPERLVDERGAV